MIFEKNIYCFRCRSSVKYKYTCALFSVCILVLFDQIWIKLIRLCINRLFMNLFKTNNMFLKCLKIVSFLSVLKLPASYGFQRVNKLSQKISNCDNMFVTRFLHNWQYSCIYFVVLPFVVNKDIYVIVIVVFFGALPAAMRPIVCGVAETDEIGYALRKAGAIQSVIILWVTLL